MSINEASYEALLLKKALAQGNLQLTPIFFDIDVLDKYRSVSWFSLIRSNTIGRLKREGSWSLDFGISPGEKVIHVSAGDIADRLPPDEQAHWIKHLSAPAMSQNFMKTRLTIGACIDDGDTRKW
ncbi:MAG: hypothetical protein EXR59_00280 [Dehalococcoidia bacterium]|nr:hypothetical protein [Dehalococcoidia bacterium]